MRRCTVGRTEQCEHGEASGALTWLAKAHITAYLRCPYASWPRDRGTISDRKASGPAEQRLMTAGVAFEYHLVQATAGQHQRRRGLRLLRDLHTGEPVGAEKV